MSHILKKISVAGAGKGGNQPKPPIYKPPELGELQYGASHSFSEVVDLISDGPIEGLVDKDGHILQGLRILQGIYLDDTPVAVSNRPASDVQITQREVDAADILNVLLEGSISATNRGSTNLSRFFKELALADQRSNSAKVTSLLGGREEDAREDVVWPNCPMYFRIRQKDVEFLEHNGDISGISDEFGALDPLSFRAFIRNLEDSKTFEFFQDGEKVTGLSATNAETVSTGSPRSIFYLDQATTADARVMISLYSGETYAANIEGTSAQGRTFTQGENQDFFPDSITEIQDFIQTQLDEILQLFNDTIRPAGPSRTFREHPIQKRLAVNALSNLGWNENSGGIDSTLLQNKLLEGESDVVNPCMVVVIKVDESDDDLDLDISAGETVDGETIIHPMITRPFGTTRGYGVQTQLEELGVKYIDVTCPTINRDGVLQGEMKGFVILKIPFKVSQNVLTLENFLRQQFGRVSHDNFIDEIAGNRNQLDHFGLGQIISKGMTYFVDSRILNIISDIESFKYSKTLIPRTLSDNYSTSDLKFNYSNVLAEFRKGTEYQEPLSYFNNVFIDHVYGRQLFGPFMADKIAEGDLGKPERDVTGPEDAQKFAPQRIAMNRELLTRDNVLERGAEGYNLAVTEGGLPIDEGSDDKRTNARNNIVGYSEWANRSLTNWNEDAVPVLHTVYNPNVTKAFITLNVNALSDTLLFKVNPDEAETDLDTASKFPAVLNIKVETGSLGLTTDGREGIETPFKTYTYRIVALIEGQTVIDIGNPDYRGNKFAGESREIVVNLAGGDEDLNAGFELPPTVTTKQQILSADGERGIEAGTIDSDSTEKRYVKVTKLSFETNSVLLNKSVSLDKVTEIIPTPLPYPYSAIIGTKLDSKSFSAIPRRTFDCKLKKVKIPSNYTPVRIDGIDKRYYNNQELFDTTPRENKLVYEGDWDGTFKDGLHWTDNPAWILYDLLTNYRYGMGSHIDISTINIWELYKIGRFCDAVDDQGFFLGVTDGRGGKEPRFSCNIVFDQGQKIFDAINTVAGLFRGRVFFSDSNINFSDDRPKNPTNLFTNENVKDGLFFYSNNRRDEQFNTIEVAYNDRFDNFVPKIEVVEDEDNIKEKGIFKKRIEGVGITSRAMARRVAQHQIFSKIKENQQVAFTAGLESLLCKPGDLILVEDELKTNKSNFGKVLAVDTVNQTVRVTNTFVDATMNGVLTVMNPTGDDSPTDIQTGFAGLNRQRYTQIKITGSDVSVPWSRYTGIYDFSGYKDGYSEASGQGPAITDTRYQNYALYTGLPESGTVLYFETGVTGWVFASGTGENNKSAFDLASGDFISELTGDQTLAAIGTGKIVELDLTQADKRSTNAAKQYGFSGFDPLGYIGQTRGVFISELDNTNAEQLTKLTITGDILSGPVEMESKGFNHYGSVLSGFDRPEILQFIKLGSAAKVDIKDADPFIYKVISMQEENLNEYLVTATKFDTGKYELIEDNISIERLANTFSYQGSQTIGGITYETLPAPSLYTVVSGMPNITKKTFSITGGWSAVANATGYNIRLKQPNGTTISITEPETSTGLQFNGLNQVGPFRYSVNALGDKVDTNPRFFDSQYDTSGVFVLYEDLLTFSKSFIDSIRIS